MKTLGLPRFAAYTLTLCALTGCYKLFPKLDPPRTETFTRYSPYDYTVISQHAVSNLVLVQSAMPATRRIEGIPTVPLTNGQKVAVGFHYEQVRHYEGVGVLPNARLIRTDIVPIELVRR